MVPIPTFFFESLYLIATLIRTRSKSYGRKFAGNHICMAVRRISEAAISFCKRGRSNDAYVNDISSQVRMILSDAMEDF